MRKIVIAFAALALMTACCKKDPEGVAKIIEKPNIQVQNGQFTPEVMWSLGRMGEKAVSPDGKQVAYTLTYSDMEENKNNTEIYVMPADGGEVTRLTTTAKSEYNIQWLNDNTLFFCRGTELISMDVPSKGET